MVGSTRTARAWLAPTLAAMALVAGASALAVTAATGRGASAAGAGHPAVAGIAPSIQFDVIGVLQSAAVDAIADAHSGGALMVDGHQVLVPANTIVTLPANALTWQELFTHAPAPYTNVATGMALKDSPKPLITYEAHVIGNRVQDANGTNGCVNAGGCDRYIAALVDLRPALAAGAGTISAIDYGAGEIEVSGTPGAKGTGARVRLNDPANPTSGAGGRFGRAMTPDDRLQVDQDNPTVVAETGFPMCLPRVTADPTIAGNPDDPLCPQANRPKVSNPVVDTSDITPQPNTLVAGQYYTLFRMDAPANVDAVPPACRTSAGVTRPCTDPRKQAPFEVGDFVTFSGTLVQDGGANGGQYVSAHTLTASLGIYTQPGVDPAYVTVNVSIIGTGGLTVFGATEAAARSRFEGMTTDESRLIRVYGVDVNPATGVTSDREWGTTLPDLGAPAGAVRGRWRFRPPCIDTPATIRPDRGCTPPPAGTFLPPTREVRAVITGLGQFVPGTITANPASQVPGTPSAKTSANGIFYGQYHAPIAEYVFPENVPGTPVPPNNVNAINFLAYGGYQSNTGVQAARLAPWPHNVLPAPLVCAAPTLIGAPYSVAGGSSVALSATVTAGATTPVTVQWTAGTGPYGTATGTNLNGALTNAATTTATFNATGLAAGTYAVNVAVANPCGVSVASTTITVSGAPKPVVNPIPNQTVTAGNAVTITAASTSTPTPTWTWAQTAGPATTIVQSPSAATPSVTSAITVIPLVAGTYTYTATATNSSGASSPVAVTITVTASVPVNVTFGGTLEYRTSKSRLALTATSTDPAVTSMVLQPYLTETGTVFDPATLGANLTVSLAAPGSFTFTLVGAPRPACNLGGTYATPCAQTPITVKSFTNGVLAGTSLPTAVQRIRA